MWVSGGDEDLWAYSGDGDLWVPGGDGNLWAFEVDLVLGWGREKGCRRVSGRVE